MPRGRRSLTDFEHWEQRIISTASKWKGWSITKDQRGRVLIRRREASRPSETVTMPRPIVWEEAYETDIQDWAKELWTNIVTAMRDAGIGEVTKSKPLTFRRRTDVDGHRKMSA